jgi:hypothetical protein
LKVCIHDHNGISLGVMETRSHGNLMAKVACEAEIADVGVFSMQIPQEFQGAIAAAVIDKDQFGLTWEDGGDSAKALVEFWKIFLFVIDGDNDGQCGMTHRNKDWSNKVKLILASVAVNTNFDGCGRALRAHTHQNKLELGCDRNVGSNRCANTIGGK